MSVIQTPPGNAQPSPVPDDYDSNVQSLQFTSKKGVLQYGFGIITQFTGNIIYNNPEEPISLYGGTRLARGNFNNGKWDNAMWPGQVQSYNDNGNPSGPGGEYLKGNNPPCGNQSVCTWSKGSTTELNPTIPDLSQNKCCNPYLDKASFLLEGNDWIFNSYYGACYSGYLNNYDWCSNKQIWIQATVDEIGSTVYGDYGVPALEISRGLNINTKTGASETLIQNSRNTKDRVFMGGRGNRGGNAGPWNCKPTDSTTNPACVFPVNTSSVIYAPHNLPQKSLNGNWDSQFPYVQWSDTRYWSAANLPTCSQYPPNGCPNDCPNPQGWQRWGAKYMGSGNPSNCNTSFSGDEDNPADWRAALPGDGLGLIGVWMPRGYKYNLQYSPSIAITSSVTSKTTTQPIFNSTTFTLMTEEKTQAEQLQKWLSDIITPTLTPTSKQQQNNVIFSPDTIQYLLYGITVYSISNSIFNDFYTAGGSKTPSGLTIFNTFKQYMNVWNWENNKNPASSPSKTNVNEPPIVPSTTEYVSQAVNGLKGTVPTPGPLPPGITNAGIWRNATNSENIHNVVMLPKITRSTQGTSAKQTVVYTLEITESLLQFQSATAYSNIVTAYANNDWPTLSSLLNTHISNIANGFFGSGDKNSGEYLSIGGTPNGPKQIQLLEVKNTGTSAKESGVKFNTFDFVHGTSMTGGSDPYSFFNINGVDHDQYSNLGVAVGDTNVISITYTATIHQWSPMAVLYYAFNNAGSKPLDYSDKLCKNSQGNLPIPNLCVKSLLETNPTNFLNVCINTGGTTQSGGIIYSPPKKVFIVNGNASLARQIPKIMGPTLTGNNGVPNFLMTSDSKACQCVQNRLQLQPTLNATMDPVLGMCFSQACSMDERNCLGLTPEKCSSGDNCTQICNYVQGLSLENIDDFDEIGYQSVCGKPCDVPRYQSGRLNPDVLAATGIIIATYIATHLILSKNSSLLGKIFHSIIMAALIGSFGYIVSKTFNGNFACGTVVTDPGMQGAGPGKCLPTWPFGGKTTRSSTGQLQYENGIPEWIQPYWKMLTLPNDACPMWYKIPCECGLNTVTAGELNCFCGGACGCRNQRCFATVDGMKTLSRDIPVSKINYIWIITLIIIGIFLMLIGKRYLNDITKINGILKILIYVLIVILPAGVYYLLNMKPYIFKYHYVDCNSKSPLSKPPPPCPAK